MQSLTPEDSFYLSAGKRSRIYEWGKTVAAFIAFLLACIAIIVAAFALNKANDMQAQLVEIQTKPLQSLQPISESQKQDANLCSLVETCQGDQSGLKNQDREQLENLQRQIGNIQNQTHSIQQTVDNLIDNQCVCNSTSQPVVVETNPQLNCGCNATNESFLSLQNQISAVNQSLNSFLRFPWPYNGKVYSLTDSRGSWNNTRQQCQSRGADLAVDGIKDYTIRLTVAMAMNLQRVWVGITDIHQEGNWTWIDGTIGNDSEILWVENQPDNYNGAEHCGELWPNFSHYMNDEPCSTQNLGLCEKDYEE